MTGDVAFADRFRDRVLSARAALETALGEAVDQQTAVLRDVLAEHGDTVFGVEHGFRAIADVDTYRRAVPIRDYEAMLPWVARAAHGEHNILTAEDPVVFLHSSGTTGHAKRIPMTRRFMHTSFFPFYYAAWAPFVEHHPETVRRADATLNLKHDPTVAADTTTGGKPQLGASQVKFGALFGEPLAVEPGSTAPWTTLPADVEPDDHLEKDYLRLRMAVEADVRCIIGINPAWVAALPRQLSRWWPRIVKDLHDGTLGGRPFGSPDRERAAELERIAGAPAGLRPFHLWPNMELIYCWPTGLASLYLPRVCESFGPGVTVLPAPVAASEGAVAVALDRHTTAESLIVSGALYEFVDADHDLHPDSPTVLLDELEPNREYHVIFTHCGGMYRYAVGDVVRVVDHHLGVPRVEYAGRRTRSDVAGERLRDGEVVASLRAALAGSGLEVTGATCRPIVDAGMPRYEFLLAPRLAWSRAETHTVTARLDDALTTTSPHYRQARRAGHLAAPMVRLLDADAFRDNWLARVEMGVRPTQVKDRVFERDDANWARLVASALSEPGATR